MYDVLLFVMKLLLFLSAAVCSVAEMRLPVNILPANMQIASVQIVVCSVVLCIYQMCAEILAAIRDRRTYDPLEDSMTDDATASDMDTGDSGEPVTFQSVTVLKQHVVLVHATGFLVWNTVYALDYSQPDLAYSFTVGIVAAWLFEAVLGVCSPSRAPTCRDYVHLFVYAMCALMLAAVNMIDEKLCVENAVGVLCGFAWPCFFSRHSQALCRRPEMLMHSIRASQATCLLLCFTPLVAWPVDLDGNDTRDLFLVFVVQPAIKVMCLLILCISVQTGHTTDIVIVLSVSSCSQFLLLYPLDRAYQIVCILFVSVLLSVHVFCLCYRSARPVCTAAATTP